MDDKSSLPTAAAYPNNSVASMSWDGFNLYGDVKSITMAKVMLHAYGLVPMLQQRIRELQDAKPSCQEAGKGEPVTCDPLDALRFGANVAETLLDIGRKIGFGRAQQILGEQWEAEHDCAPRGQMGVTVGKCIPPKMWNKRGQDAYRRGWDECEKAYAQEAIRPYVEALRDLLGWFPGPAAWNTEFPTKAAERARSLLAGSEGHGATSASGASDR